MIHAANEVRAALRYQGEDPRLQGAEASYGALIEGLTRAGSLPNFAEQSKAERDCLLQCGAQGWRLDAEALRETLKDRLGGGNEHDVFFDEDTQRVIKITQSTTSYGAQGSALAYFTNLSRCNRFFGDAIRFEGLVARETGGDAIVISQPFVVGARASEESIAEFFWELGFKPAGPNAFDLLDESGRSYFIADARPDNVLREHPSGLICPIDVQVTVTEAPP